MREKKLLIYSYDSFGLGHLRRCRSIALSLVQRDPGLRVMIVSGLPLISRYDQHPRIEITLVPQIIKQRSGEYRPRDEAQDLGDAIAERAQRMVEAADRFDPDLMLVDKEPTGIRGEVCPTLEMLRARGVPMVLGLRDVLDDPASVAAEWRRKQSVQALEAFYDEVWIYGLEQIYEPLAGLALPADVERRLVYTSYLRRSAETMPAGASRSRDGYLLVTPGGGGDGEELVDSVLGALESDPGYDRRIVIVCGPFMAATARDGFARRAARLAHVTMADFVPSMEALMAGAAGIVAMGGYNTFCEILSFDQQAIIVPRTTPRLEQHIRAARAESLGLVRMLTDTDARDPERLLGALRALPDQPRPSAAAIPGLLDGHAVIAERFDALLASAAVPMRRAAGAIG